MLLVSCFDFLEANPAFSEHDEVMMLELDQLQDVRSKTVPD